VETKLKNDQLRFTLLRSRVSSKLANMADQICISMAFS
jgi:hypothetical protein